MRLYRKVILLERLLVFTVGVHMPVLLRCSIGVSGIIIQRHNYKDEIQIVFEAGTQGQGQVDTMLRELSKTSSWQEKEKWPVSGWTFQNKSVIPLQAADLVAYEYYRVAEKALIRKQRLGFRKSALDLFRKEEATYSFREFDKRAFTLWAQRWNERVESMKKGSV